MQPISEEEVVKINFDAFAPSKISVFCMWAIAICIIPLYLIYVLGFYIYHLCKGDLDRATLFEF